MKIRIFTNEVAGGWRADSIEQFLGGGEECVVLLAEAFVRSGYDVYVYHTFPSDYTKGNYTRNGVYYGTRESVECSDGDILISFKDTLPWRGKESDASVKIHWSSEVEKPWNLQNVDAVVCLSEFHASRMIFVPSDKRVVIPCGIDTASLDRNEISKVPNTMLYCSSPDRGLMQLLSDWRSIANAHSGLELRIAYGFGNLEKMHSKAAAFKSSIFHKFKQDGITYLGELSKNDLEREYYRAEYWVLPLSNPESELFCLNAVKSRYCGCKPVVNRLGALKDTVGDYIPYPAFVSGNKSILTINNSYDQCLSWDTVVNQYWMPLFESILTSL